jgi:hypothetical protein
MIDLLQDRLNKQVDKVTTKQVNVRMTGDTIFYPEVWAHKESYILVEVLTKSRVSLNPFLTQVITKIEHWATHYHKGTLQISQGSPHKAVAQEQPLIV